MRLTRPLIIIVAALAIGLGCGADAPLELGPLSPAANAPAEAPPAPPTARELHAEATGALLASGFSVRDAAALEVAPIQRLTLALDPDAGGYTGTLSITVFNSADVPLQALSFALPVNTDATAPAVTVDGVTVGPVDVAPRGDARAFDVPVAIAPGASATVALAFTGRLPARSSVALPNGLADLRALIELVDTAEARADAFGRQDDALVLARFYPMLLDPSAPASALDAADRVPLPVAHFEVAISAPSALSFAGTGVMDAPDTPQALRTVRFVATGVREVAYIAAPDLVVVSEQRGDVLITAVSRGGGAATAQRALKYARRAVEVHADAFGDYPWSRLVVAEVPLGLRSGALVYPAFIGVSEQLWLEPGANVPEGDLAMALLSRHPILSETLEWVVARAVAGQWWGQLVAIDHDGSPWAASGLASLGALRYFDAVHGADIARRQMRVHLTFAFQLAGFLGASDQPVDIQPDMLVTSQDRAAIVYAKAGLFFERLARQTSAPLFYGALRGLLREHAYGRVTARALVRRVIDAAPQPDVARDVVQRWLGERHAAADIGPLDPGVVFETLVTGSAGDMVTRELLVQLTGDPELRKILGESLGAGDYKIMAGHLLKQANAELGPSDPMLRRIIDLAGDALATEPHQWGPDALGLVLGQFGDDLGIDTGDRLIIQGAAGLLLKGLLSDDEETPTAPASPSPAPAP